MPTINNIEELVAVLGEVIATDNPLEALQARGFTFSDPLKQKLATAKPHKKLTLEEHKQWAQAVKALGPVRFRVRAAPRTPRSLPVGEYDLIVSLRLEVLSQVLAGLYAIRTWPRVVPAGSASQLVPLSDLRAFSDGVPAGGDIAVGAIHLTAPATVSPVNGTEHLILSQPFALDIDRVLPGPVGLPNRRVRATSLVGILRFGVLVFAEFEISGQLKFLFDGVGPSPGDPEAIRINVDPTSPLQSRNAQALAALEAAVQSRFNDAVATHGLQESYSICPVINLPVGAGIPIRIQRVDIRAVSTSDGGALMVGVLLGPTATPDAEAGDPARLTNPFTVDVANLYVRVHEELLRKIVRQAFESGELQRRARQKRDDLVIDGADVEFKPNEIRIIVDARLVDVCGVWPFTFKDLSFTATKIFRYAVFGGEVVVTEEQEIDKDNGDAFICAILGLLEALIPVVVLGPVGVIGTELSLIRQIIHFAGLDPGGPGGDPKQLGSVFNPKFPVPGTELLPRVEALQSLVEDGSLRSNGVMTLREDDVNTYVYAAFLQRGPVVSQPQQSLVGVHVALVDQDAPAPPADDVSIPLEEEQVVFQGSKRRTTVKTKYESAHSDQVLAQGTTNDRGRVKFILRPDQLRTTSGTLITTTTTEYLDTGEIDIKTDREELPEQQPDVFFRVTLSDGSVVDTRSLTAGPIINLQAKHVGTADAPLTFVLSSPFTHFP